MHDDNVAMIQVMITGKNPTMRGLGNTHGVSINRLEEAFDESWNNLVKEDTNTMAGDIFTKAFESKYKWTQACSLINIFDMKLIKYVPRVAGGAKSPQRSIHRQIKDPTQITYVNNPPWQVKFRTSHATAK